MNAGMGQAVSWSSRRSPGTSIILFFLFLGVFSFPAVSEEHGRPPWVLYEIAERYYRSRSYARALEHYGQALAKHPLFPEAHAGIARVHQAAGDRDLAIRSFRQALEMSRHLSIPEEHIRLRLELVEIYSYLDGEEARLLREEQLLDILRDDPVFSRTIDEGQRDAMRNLLYRSGLDRVLVLYRLHHPQVSEAHRLRGADLLESSQPGDIDLAVEHLLFAAVIVASRAVDAIIDRRYDFEFTTLKQFFLVAQAYPEVEGFLETSKFREILSLLAESLDASSDSRGAESARSLRAALQDLQALQAL
ncbi:tetratricopeptide repeat protein [Alkalispirochaeta americana]|uniref:tetratricopeptide repeat protein n=1 Tax=Alkalispirochaeta americana TaxID=159291 RepID=UPI00117AF7D9|nr:tetratricopeptide repeat protein [Alkalispirochaeta americana]